MHEIVYVERAVSSPSKTDSMHGFIEQSPPENERTKKVKNMRQEEMITEQYRGSLDKRWNSK